MTDRSISSNLITRLRELHKFWHETDELKDAADEIERLREENQSLRNLADNLRPGPISQALQDSPDYSGQTIERLRAIIRNAIDHMGEWEYDDMRHWQLDAEAALTDDSSAPETKKEQRPLHLNAYQLKQALDLCGGEEDTELVFLKYAEDRHEPGEHGEPMPAGTYCWFPDYPEEGQLLLKEERPEGSPEETAADPNECQNLRCRQTGKCVGTLPCVSVHPPAQKATSECKHLPSQAYWCPKCNPSGQV